MYIHNTGERQYLVWLCSIITQLAFFCSRLVWIWLRKARVAPMTRCAVLTTCCKSVSVLSRRSEGSLLLTNRADQQRENLVNHTKALVWMGERDKLYKVLWVLRVQKCCFRTSTFNKQFIQCILLYFFFVCRKIAHLVYFLSCLAEELGSISVSTLLVTLLNKI